MTCASLACARPPQGGPIGCSTPHAPLEGSFHVWPWGSLDTPPTGVSHATPLGGRCVTVHDPSPAHAGGSCLPCQGVSPTLRCASTTRAQCVEGAHRRRGYPQRWCIPTTPLARPIRARTWVTIEVSGHRKPNHAYGVCPRRDHRVWRVHTDGGGPPNICASQSRCLYCPFVHVLEWP